MPELFEVKKAAAILMKHAKMRKITAIDLPRSNYIKNVSPEVFKQTLIGQTIYHVSTYAKYTLIEFSQCKMLIHYRSTGYFLANDDRGMVDNFFSQPMTKKTLRMRWYLNDGGQVHYYDSRTLSHIKLYPRETPNYMIPELSKLDIEVTDSAFTLEYLQNWGRRNPQTPIKDFLLDQTRGGSGVGLYHCLEALHDAEISPWEVCASLTQEQWSRLYESIKWTMHMSDTHDDYNWWRVFRRKGNCLHGCGVPIVREESKGRGIYHCPKCQVLNVAVSEALPA